MRRRFPWCPGDGGKDASSTRGSGRVPRTAQSGSARSGWRPSRPLPPRPAPRPHGRHGSTRSARVRGVRPAGPHAGRRFAEGAEAEPGVGAAAVLVGQCGQAGGELLGARLARRQQGEPAAAQVGDGAAGAPALAGAAEGTPARGTQSVPDGVRGDGAGGVGAGRRGRAARTASMSLPTSCAAALSTVVTYVPPGRSTRAHSATAARTSSGSASRCSSQMLVTASNEPDGKGSRRLSARTIAPGSRTAARRTMAGVRSAPVTRSPGRAAASRRVTIPVPQATSRRRPGPPGIRARTACAASWARASPPRKAS